MRKFILFMVLICCESAVLATKISSESYNKFENIFRKEGYSRITQEINDSMLLNPELPQSWAGYSAARNIAYNKYLTIGEKRGAIEMILEKLPSVKETKRIRQVLRNIK